MKSQVLWQEHFVIITQPPPDSPIVTNTVWSIAFKQDGSEFIMALGDRVLVYES